MHDSTNLRVVTVKKYLAVFVITFTWIVFLIPYLALDFYNQFLEAYHLTDGQLGNLITYFGLTATPGYFIGGWIADKFNAKKLVVLSCLLTALAAVGVSFCNSYIVLLILYFVMGFTSAGLQWSAYLKVVRASGDDEEQGKLYGATDTAYGIFTILMTYGILALLSSILESTGMGFRGAILIYAAISAAIGVAVIFFVPYDAEKSKTEDGGAIKLELVGKVLKMPLTYYLGLFTLGYYIIRSVFPYINPYLTNVFGVSIAFATGFTMTARTGVKMISGPVGGAIRDRIGRSTPVAMIASIGAIAASVAMMLIPQASSLAIAVMIVAIIIVFFSGMASPLLYTPASEAKIPLAYTGTILGIASTIGYSSDIWLYNVCGKWLDNLGNSAYIYVYGLMAAGAVLMLIMGLLLKTCYPKAVQPKQSL
jgi:MFS family permease